MSFKRILLVNPSGRHGLSYAFDLVPTALEYIAAAVEDVTDTVTIWALEMEPGTFDEAFKGSLMALNPDLVRKMIAVGIEGFEMGMESPNMHDIKYVSKGMSADAHILAVNNIK